MVKLTENPVARTDSPYISAYEAFIVEDNRTKRTLYYYKKARSDEYYDWYVVITSKGDVTLTRFARETVKSDIFDMEHYRVKEVATLNVDVTCSLVDPTIREEMES